jgi:hypothetical protein
VDPELFTMGAAKSGWVDCVRSNLSCLFDHVLEETFKVDGKQLGGVVKNRSSTG